MNGKTTGQIGRDNQ